MEIKEASSFSGWLIALQGLLSVIFGLIILFWPGMTLAIFVYIFAFYAIFESFVALGYGISFRNVDHAWWSYIVEAIVGFLFGIAILVWPVITAVVFIYLIAGWSVVIGLIKIITGLVDRENWSGKLLASIVGILFIIFGIYLFSNPGAGALAMVQFIGLFNVIIGVFTFFFAFQVKSLGAEMDLHLPETDSKIVKKK